MPGKRLTGLAVLLLLPLLAVSGLTALRQERQVANGELVLQVEFPRVLRYLKSAPVFIRVKNAGSEPIPAAELHVGSSWLAGFTSLTMTPDATSSDANGLIVDLGDIAAGEARSVRLELRGSEYWLQQGRISVRSGDREAAVQVMTLVLP